MNLCLVSFHWDVGHEEIDILPLDLCLGVIHVMLIVGSVGIEPGWTTYNAIFPSL